MVPVRVRDEDLGYTRRLDGAPLDLLPRIIGKGSGGGGGGVERLADQIRRHRHIYTHTRARNRTRVLHAMWEMGETWVERGKT